MMPDVKIEWIGGNCPVQAEGTINGKPFYFRARGNHWSLDIGSGEDGKHPLETTVWDYVEPYGDEPYVAGWMSEDEARGFIDKAAALYEADSEFKAALAQG